MKDDILKFRIDQLRKDKIIYASEAAATALTCLLGFLFTNMFLEEPAKYIISLAVLVAGVGYTLYMGIGNAWRLGKIRELEHKLYS